MARICSARSTNALKQNRPSTRNRVSSNNSSNIDESPLQTYKNQIGRFFILMGKVDKAIDSNKSKKVVAIELINFDHLIKGGLGRVGVKGRLESLYKSNTLVQWKDDDLYGREDIFNSFSVQHLEEEKKFKIKLKSNMNAVVSEIKDLWNKLVTKLDREKLEKDIKPSKYGSYDPEEFKKNVEECIDLMGRINICQQEDELVGCPFDLCVIS